MKRRDFVRTLGTYGLGGLLPSFTVPYRPLPSLLVPMDDAQTDHLKAYGLAYRAIQAGLKAEWLLNYRGGSFLIPDLDALRRDAALNGMRFEPVDSGIPAVRGEIEANNMDAVPLEKAPKVAVYAPPNAAPWDDAVTMALQYAGIPFTKIWDAEVMNGGLRDFDWLHLHHEDFTGQYSKFFLIYSGMTWLGEMVQRNSDMARRLGFQTVPDLKKAVARGIHRYVENGGFLFAMCTATETIDLAFAAHNVDIAATFADGTALGPDADAKLDWSQSFVRTRLKPGVTILAEEEGAPWVKYIHGDLGKGTWTFFGGHDPEDAQHQIGDPRTDLSLHPHSPGYRLILNNVLFPAAKKRELKT